MNLLSKLSSSTKAKTIEPREIFMTLPSKAPGYGYPRDVQSEVWKKWFDIRNEKNVILKMNTGRGICSFLIGCTVKSRSASGRIKGSCPQGKGTFCM